MMLTGGPSGGGTGGVTAKEIGDLREKLMISESLFEDMTKSWEQKLLETARIHEVRRGE